ncbi:MAG TPA: Xaa-Pro peptidase family protein [Solirubrobacterales bacterium]|nr:Xaa-Pro peptidase family protein [Solirubrobacterales bacterium]
MAEVRSRLSRLRQQLIERELDQLLVTDLVNVRYLSGFTGTNGTLLVAADQAVLLTDFRYLSQAAEQSPDWEVVDGGREPRKRLAERMTGRVGFDDAQMTVQSHVALEKEISEDVQLAPTAGIVEQLRAVKDSAEIATIARAAGIADSIYEALSHEGLTGRTEKEIAWRIAVLAHEAGAEGLSFPPIVAAGAHGALPHAEPRARAIERGDLVVLDLGVTVDGYCSDATRTFAVGEPAADQRDVYELVLRAQMAALDTVRAGAACSAVDAAARDIIDAAGHGEAFGHSTGHGVGLAVHELPTVAARSEMNLETGNVVTIEPGVYLEGRFGIRIEDLIVIEAGAPRVLSGFGKQLLVVD